MIASPRTLKSSVIVSVYTDYIALDIILSSLKTQTCTNFEVIISEDGQSEAISNCIENHSNSELQLTHLSQEDVGFRKNLCLNKAIKAANAMHLIFIDGDCIPHPRFVEAHQSHAGTCIAATGRRLELGMSISEKIRNDTSNMSSINSRLRFLLSIPALKKDHSKNVGCGVYSKLLQLITVNRKIRLLGSNFSCSKQDLIKINGFNEDYHYPGIGEDSDIDWRLIKAGVRIKNVKFSAIQYHLYHPRTYSPSEENNELFRQTKLSDGYICNHGLDHIGE